MLKVFSQQNKRSVFNNLWKTSCTRANKFTNCNVFKTLWIYTVLFFDPTNEPKTSFSTTKKAGKTSEQKVSIQTNFQEIPSVVEWKCSRNHTFFKTTSASVFSLFWSKREQKGNVRNSDKPHELINHYTWAKMYSKVFIDGRQTLFCCFLFKKEQKVRFHRAFLVKNCRSGTGLFLLTLSEISPFSS